MAESSFNSVVNSLLEGMEGFLSSKTVVGEPVKVGDTLKVRVIEIDDHGKVKVSAKEFMEKPENLPEGNGGRRLEHSQRPDKSIKGPRKFKK